MSHPQKEIRYNAGNGNKLVEEWKNTQHYFRKFRPREESVLIDINDLNSEIENNNNSNSLPQTVIYVQEKEEEEVQSSKAILDIRNIDTISMCVEYVDDGFNPLVLNMASDYCPGGGVAKGCLAQEECLFRCTNAHQTHPQKFYPLKPNEMIYSPSVVICKNTKYNNIQEREISMLACAAIRRPALDNNNDYKNGEDAQLMREKIDAIFKIAEMKGHDSLILSALGCGAFQNPPFKVAQMFKHAVHKNRNKFKKIGFGILVVSPKDSNNLLAFQRAFQNQ